MDEYEYEEYDECDIEDAPTECLVENLYVQEKGSRVELHLYHSGVSSLTNINQNNPLLTVLILIGQPLKTLWGVEHLHHLKELWAVECKLKDITAIENCPTIEKLYLYSNSILEIPNLVQLTNLQVLWLSGNGITCLKNVDLAKQLEELNLSNNKITTVGSSLEFCPKLHILNLSGNPLFRLKDMCQLAHVPKLASLLLGDPMYGPSPVVQLCNYRSFMVYHVPQVQILDQHEIDSEERCRVKEFYNTKLMFYSMLHRHALTLFCQAKKEKEKEDRSMLTTFREHHYTYALQKMKNKKQTEKSKGKVVEDLPMKIQHLHVKILKWNEHMEEWICRQKEDMKIRQWQMNLELQNAGNLTFTAHSDTSQLVSVGQKLLDSYTCYHLYRKLSIVGVKVLQVTQVYNKGLEIACRALSWNKDQFPSTLCLLTSPKGIHQSSTWPFHIFEEGFVQEMDFEMGISDCLYSADKEWINAMSMKCKNNNSKCNKLSKEDQNERRIAIIVQFPTDLLLVRQKSYQNTYLPSFGINSRNESTSQVSTRTRRSNWRKLHSKSETTAPSHKVCNNYLVSNSKEVMPTYVMEYQYLFEDPLEMFRQNMGWTGDIHSMPLNPVNATPHPLLNKNTLCKFVGPEPWCSLTTINLAGLGIQSIDNLPKLMNVTELNLSYNKLITLIGLDIFPSLVTLNISYNSIISLAEIVVFPNLKDLNISWNFLNRLLPAFKSLGQISPLLNCLDISYNPVEDVTDLDHITHFACMYLQHLVQLNGTTVEELLQRRLNKQLYARGRAQRVSAMPLVTLYWAAESYRQIQGDCGNNEVPHWVSLKGMYLTKMNNKDLMEVKWADFSYNLLHDLDFLAVCETLQELSLAHNLIKTLNDSLNTLSHLVKLDLSHNYLECVKELFEGHFPYLKLLDVSGNLLTDLAGVDACSALLECYASNNKITSYDGILFAKSCQCLRVLDVTGNGIDLNEEFRNLVVFYFRRIEFLNGNCIQESDVEDANQLFGGYLDQDYLLKHYKRNELLHLTELTLSQCAIHKVSLSPNTLPVLRSLDMSYNEVTCLWGFRMLHTLKTLCLSFNQVVQFYPNTDNVLMNDEHTHNCFPKLETLYLNNNDLPSLKDLNLNLMPNLKSLFAQDNDITSLDGLQGVAALRHLILDRNNIQNITSEECSSLANLHDLYLEGNRIKYLFFVKNLKHLQRLFLAHNRINDSSQIRHLASLDKLEELTLMGNPVSIKHLHYNTILQCLPLLSLLDGHPLEPSNYASD